CDRPSRGRPAHPKPERPRGRWRPCPGSRRALARLLLRQAPLQREQLALLHGEAVLRGWERTVADLTVEFLKCGRHRRADVRVALGELRLELAIEAENVVKHEHLAIAIHARADPDGRDRKTLGRERTDRRGNALQHDRESSGVLERESVFDEATRGARGLRLHLEAAELRDALRRETNVR